MSAEATGSATPPTASYGAWPSPIDARDLVTGASHPIDGGPQAGPPWWPGPRPDQGGRQQIVRRNADGTIHDPLPEGWNARTRVHEYGGAAWWPAEEVIFTVD